MWVEPLFAEAKDWHGLRRFRLRRLEKVNIEALLIAAGQNIKRLVAARDRGPRKLAQVAVLRPPDPVSHCRPHLTAGFSFFRRDKGIFQQPEPGKLRVAGAWLCSVARCQPGDGDDCTTRNCDTEGTSSRGLWRTWASSTGATGAGSKTGWASRWRCICTTVTGTMTTTIQRTLSFCVPTAIPRPATSPGRTNGRPSPRW
ncbi:MAG: transposase [Rubrobacter sp.]|nr:transposase [Rubrobacter sp.]